MPSGNKAFEELKEALTVYEHPFCSGSVVLDDSTSKLFYVSGQKTGYVDFANADNDSLLALSQACEPASFGLEKDEVLDASYRKAGKMDPTNFATLFSPLTLGIIDSIRANLLRGQQVDKPVRVELYKLNVYGPGSFFKAHVDTPRSDTMFGSLVIVLPTRHEGGSLVFRHHGNEELVDTAKLVSQGPSGASAAFISFFSDVEHEVSPVESGYRVTITYNLYFEEQSPALPTINLPSGKGDSRVKSALSALLLDSTFLPHGGFIGFELLHKYPINPSRTRLSELADRLKGSDAVLRQICDELSLPLSLNALYRPERSYGNIACLLDSLTDVPELRSEQQLEDDILTYLRDEYDGTLVYNFSNGRPKSACLSEDEFKDAKPIAWVRPAVEANTFKTSYTAYFGNSPGLDCVYGTVVLVATIRSAKKRLTKKDKGL